MHSESLAKATRHSTTLRTLVQQSRTLYDDRPSRSHEREKGVYSVDLSVEIQEKSSTIYFDLTEVD